MDKKSVVDVGYRQATLSDKNDLFYFYSRVYPDHSMEIIEKRWNWEQIINPYNPDKSKIGIWIAFDTETNKILGQTGVVYEKFKLGDHIILIGWGIDLVVDPGYRGRNIAFNLQKIMIASVDAYMNVSMANSTRTLSMKLGSYNLPPVFQLILPLVVPPKRVLHYLIQRTYASNAFSSKLKRKFFKNRIFGLILFYSGGLNYFRRNWINVSRIKQPFSTKILIRPYCHETDLDAIDSLWYDYRDQYSNWAQRDSINFTWKYFDDPLKKHNCFVVFQEGIMIGYFVLRCGDEIENNVGLIVDIVINKENLSAVCNCIEFSRQYFLEKGSEFIYVTLSCSQLISQFQNSGFKQTRIHYPVFHSNRAELADHVTRNQNWYLTFSDHELNRYPLRGK